MSAGLTGEQWRDKLVAIAAHLKFPASLCLTGSPPRSSWATAA